MVRKSVVLPPPFGPVKARISPAFPPRVTPSSTGWPLKPAVTPLSDHASGPGAEVRGTFTATTAVRQSLGAWAWTRPFSTDTTLSALRTSCSSRCSEITSVRPVFRSRDADVRTNDAPSGSSWEVGSSRTTSRGCMARTAAKATRWRSPPLRERMRRPTKCCAPASASASSTRDAIAKVAIPIFSRPNATSRSTVS